jgi:hypothetical protein
MQMTVLIKKDARYLLQPNKYATTKENTDEES